MSPGGTSPVAPKSWQRMQPAVSMLCCMCSMLASTSVPSTAWATGRAQTRQRQMQLLQAGQTLSMGTPSTKLLQSTWLEHSSGTTSGTYTCTWHTAALSLAGHVMRRAMVRDSQTVEQKPGSAAAWHMLLAHACLNAIVPGPSRACSAAMGGQASSAKQPGSTWCTIQHDAQSTVGARRRTLADSSGSSATRRWKRSCACASLR